jgi:type I restriction enzyme S subunit
MSSAVGKMGRYKYFEPALLNQRVGKIYVKNTFLLDKDFMYYYLNRYEIHYNLALNATGSANQANISPDQIKHIEITLPPLPEQTAIASILSALDDKIELNLQQNKTLEEIAMALYKNWFVDFGPFKDGKFIDSELGRIPEGWEVKKLGDFSIIIMGQSPKSEFYNSDRTGLPFHQGVKDFGERFPTDITYTTSGNKIAEVGEILFSVRAPVGRINIAKNKIVLGRGLASLKMKDGNGFLLYSLKNFFQKEDIIGSGTVFNSVNKTEIENIKFVKPNRELLIEFNKKITGIDELIYSNYLENENLKNLRDSLLPKLIIGEIRVKDNDH